mmetsp:Transcript_134826/g.319604  ORF Transcript_134826/g.319604 Transcript_134826/m.319604 type:complete len:222 (-) Transcript_134826:2202-2867(-)
MQHAPGADAGVQQRGPVAGAVELIRELRVAQHLPPRAGGHPICAHHVEEALQQVDHQKPRQVVRPNPSDVDPFDFVHHLQGVPEPGQQRHQDVPPHHAEHQQQGRPGVGTEDVQHVDGRAAGEDVQLHGDGHLHIGHGHAVLVGPIALEQVRHVQAHGLRRADETIEKGGQQNGGHGRDLRQLGWRGIVRSHRQHGDVVHQRQQDYVDCRHGVIVGVDEDR